ncbi:hypothetical protein IFM89_029956 [Coptis chinensis]|uniref:Methyltransferase-like protein 13 n=1 Tax=Coptis chinensis TaxID=261450 RepID=A0A835LT98_9MAGN|nr:hypothetical protein IFM89_029956 [Coptis chinensis]
MEKGTFQNLTPSQFISSTFPNPLKTSPELNPYSNSLRIAVLDSPQQTPNSPHLAAMLVPKYRENDWIFSTDTGHLQLLLNSPEISRLILIGNPPHDNFTSVYNRSIHYDSTKLEESLKPILFALSPKSAFKNGLPEIPFVIYEDNVIRSVSVGNCFGSCVGEMLVENVEIETHNTETREFRRRLRFKRMPNLVQTEIRIIPETLPSNAGIENMVFRIDSSSLVHPYLPPMVASLSLVSAYLEERLCSGSRLRVLCIGVGGGALLAFLQTHFGFQVYGVESDEMVKKIAMQYFGLVENELLRVCVGDGIEVIETLARGDNVDGFDKFDSPFDVIMVDLDASDVRNGIGAPPMEFVSKKVLLATKLALHKNGILVINVIPVCRTFYDYLISEFREVFAEVYEINVGNDENYVLIATVSPISFDLNDSGNSIMKKLKLTIPKQYVD